MIEGILIKEEKQNPMTNCNIDFNCTGFPLVYKTLSISAFKKCGFYFVLFSILMFELRV
jgi:hypothetical protein